MDFNLSTAVYQGWTNEARVLLQQGADVNRVSDGRTHLMWAAAGGHSEVVQLLIDHGAHLNIRCPDGETAIDLAAAASHINTVRLLSRAGARTTITQAAMIGDIETLRSHLEQGANVNTVDSNGFNSLLWAASEGNLETAELLLKWGADVNCRDMWEWTPLMWAAERGCDQVVGLLLTHGADASLVNVHGATALTYAIAWQYEEIIKKLQNTAA